MHKHLIAAAILKTMPRKYAKIGIVFKQRRSYEKIALSTLVSCWDLLRLILLFFSPQWTHFDKLIVAPQGVVKVKDNFAYVEKYEDLLAWPSTLVVIRSTRGVPTKRAKNLYDLTFVYVFVIFISFIITHLHCKKHLMSACQISCLTHIFKMLLIRKSNVFISDWNNPFSISCILAAKKRSIQSFELQHGVIHKNHPAYNFSSKKVQQISCDYLYYWMMPQNKSFISKLYPHEKQIYFKPTQHGTFLRKSSKSIDILFSLQDSNSSNFIEAFLPLIENMVKANIVIKPRRELSKKLRSRIYSQAPHVKVTSNNDFSALLKASYVHVSHSSTTLLDGALEKNLLNICFDFDGTALQRNPVIKDLLTNNQVVLITTKEDWLSLWSNLQT